MHWDCNSYLCILILAYKTFLNMVSPSLSNKTCAVDLPRSGQMMKEKTMSQKTREGGWWEAGMCDTSCPASHWDPQKEALPLRRQRRDLASPHCPRCCQTVQKGGILPTPDESWCSGMISADSIAETILCPLTCVIVLNFHDDSTS